MTQDVYDQTQGEAISELREMSDAEGRKQQVEALRRAMERKVDDGSILILTDEEERLIGGFRRFRAQMREERMTFKWKTVRGPGIVEPPEAVLIADPQDANPDSLRMNGGR